MDKEALARRVEAIIRTESVKPAGEAEALQAEMEASLLGEGAARAMRERRENAAGKGRPTDEEWVRKRKAYRAGEITAEEWLAFEGEYYAGREPGKGRQSFRTERREGRSWSARASPRRGVSSYRRDPETGKIIWDTAPIEWLFAKRYDLSAAVWKAVGEEEQGIFAVVRGGRALGRDVKDIAKDLETYINYGDGGKRVMARWGHMFPNTEKGRREAWKRQWLADHAPADPATGKPGDPYQMFTDEARAALRAPEAQAWIKEKMAAKTRLGTPLRPDVVKEYHKRLGTAGIDYRTMRIMRTETAAALADRQEAIARNSDICTGEVDWVLQKGRDGWNCKCAEYAAGGPYDVDGLPGPVPLHPNCFPGGTMVLMADGTEKAIAEINKGDYVIGRDGSPQTVKGLFSREYHGALTGLEIEGGKHLFISTPDHPVLMFAPEYKKWVFREAGKVSEGDTVSCYGGETGKKVLRAGPGLRAENSGFDGFVYNIETVPDHTYIANGVVVHNCDCQLRPRLKSDAQIKEELRRRTAAEDEVIRQWREQGNGTDAGAS